MVLYTNSIKTDVPFEMNLLISTDTKKVNSKLIKKEKQNSIQLDFVSRLRVQEKVKNDK